jgi:hypothetical protein
VPTFTEVLALADVTPIGDLADLTVPVLTGPQRQGDIGVWPTSMIGNPTVPDGDPIPREGVTVVRGEATGNTHILHGDGTYARVDEGIVLGYLTVPPGGEAWLIHTDEHGANGIGPGCYRLTGKREMADEIRRVVD